MKRYIGAKEYMNMLGKLSKKIESEYKPDAVLGILRGGKYPAMFVSKYFGVPEFDIRVSSYSGMNQGNIVVHGKIPDEIKKYRNVIVIDDLVDSGRTIKEVKNLLEKYPSVNFKVATIFMKPTTSEMPDFYVEVDNKWIVFPYEVSFIGALFKFYFAMNEDKYINKFKKQ